MHQTDRKSPAIWLLQLAASAAVAIVAMLLLGPSTEAAAAEPHETIRADVPNGAVSIEASPLCLADNGYFRYVVENQGAYAVEATLSLAPLEGQPDPGPIARTVNAGGKQNLSFAGRPDGRYEAAIEIDGQTVMKRLVDVHCDGSANTVTSIELWRECVAGAFPAREGVRVMGSPDWTIHLNGKLMAIHQSAFGGDPARLSTAVIGSSSQELVATRGTRQLAVTTLGSTGTCLPDVDTTFVNNELRVVTRNDCLANNGLVGLQVVNHTANRNYNVQVTLTSLDGGPSVGRPTQVVAPLETAAVGLIAGRPDGLYQLRWDVDGEPAGTRFLRVACASLSDGQPETIDVRQSCANGTNHVEVQINNRSTVRRSYLVEIGTETGNVEAESNDFTIHSVRIGNGTHRLRVVDPNRNAVLAAAPITADCEEEIPEVVVSLDCSADTVTAHIQITNHATLPKNYRIALAGVALEQVRVLARTSRHVELEVDFKGFLTVERPTNNQVLFRELVQDLGSPTAANRCVPYDGCPLRATHVDVIGARDLRLDWSHCVDTGTFEVVFGRSVTESASIFQPTSFSSTGLGPVLSTSGAITTRTVNANTGLLELTTSAIDNVGGWVLPGAQLCWQLVRPGTRPLWDRLATGDFEPACVTLDVRSAEPNIVSIGDSFAAGPSPVPGAHLNGTRDGTLGNNCHRATRSWPLQVSEQLNLQGRHMACTGAVSDDLMETLARPSSPEHQGPQESNAMAFEAIGCCSDQGEPQFQMRPGVIDDDTEFVLLSIGGNDIDFSKIVKDCFVVDGTFYGIVNPAMPWLPRPLETCPSRAELLDRVADYAERDEELLTSIRAVMPPSAHLIVVGYPHLAAREDRQSPWWQYPPCGWSSVADIRAVADRAANDRISRIADLNRPSDGADLNQQPVEATIHFVDLRNVYETEAESHAPCSRDTSWLNPVTTSLPLNGFSPMHPTQDGHDATADAVLNCIARIRNNAAPVSSNLCTDIGQANLIGVVAEQTVAAAHGSLSWRCLGGNGYLFVDVEAVIGGNYLLKLTGRTDNTKNAVIEAGQQARIGVSGRPDGTYTMQVLHEDQTLVTETFTVSCDDAPGQHDVTISSTCAANDLGLITASIGAAAPGDFTLRVVGAAPLGDKATNVANRGQIGRSGRPDGVYRASVLTDGVEIATSLLEFTCQADAEPEATINWRCVVTTGYGYIATEITAARTGTYALRIEGPNTLPDRTLVIAAGESARIARSGRPGGDYTVSVLFNGNPITTESFELDCGR